VMGRGRAMAQDKVESNPVEGEVLLRTGTPSADPPDPPRAAIPNTLTLDGAVQSLVAVAEPGDIVAVIAALADSDPEMAAIFRRAAVRTELDTYARCDADAAEQQRRLFREITVSNVCLMFAGV